MILLILLFLSCPIITIITVPMIVIIIVTVIIIIVESSLIAISLIPHFLILNFIFKIELIFLIAIFPKKIWLPIKNYLIMKK